MTADLSQISRERKCELGYIRRATGSCFYSLGDTVVLASINGPGDVKASKQLAERAIVEITFHPKIMTPANSSNSNWNIENLLRTICDSQIMTNDFPRCLIGVTIQEMHDDGCLTASAINAVCLSLLDAGLPLRSIFAAVYCIYLTSENGDTDILLVEPNLKQERFENVRARLLFVFENRGSASKSEGVENCILISCSMDGVISKEKLKDARENARRKAVEIFSFYRTVIEKTYRRQMEFVGKLSKK